MIVDWGDVFIVVYLDDMVVYRLNPVWVWFETKLVLEHLAAVSFMLDTAKSHFLASEMKMLGY